MSAEGVIVGTVVGVVAGVVSAVVTNEALKKHREEAQKAELEDAIHRSYNTGWHDASNHAGNIQQRYREMYLEADQEEGTTTKSRRG